jgi:hypothetical protein
VELKPVAAESSLGGIVIEKGEIKIRLPLGISGKEIRAVMEGAGFLS